MLMKKIGTLLLSLIVGTDKKKHIIVESIHSSLRSESKNRKKLLRSIHTQQ